MRIDKQTYATWMDTLSRSRQVMLEQGAFGLYLPKEDRVLHTVHPDELPEGCIEKRLGFAIHFNEGLEESIKAFNSGNAEYVEIGPHRYNKGEGKVFNYHTHPGDTWEITPSNTDGKYVRRNGIPLVIILAGALLPHIPQKPFVIGYDPNYFPEGEEDLSNLNPMEQRLGKEAEKLGIPNDVLTQLIFSKYYSGLPSSVNFEIE